MEKRERTYVDDAVDSLFSVYHQINFVIDIMGGYRAKLDPERENFRSFIGNIGDQVVQQISFLSDAQRTEVERSEVYREGDIYQISKVIEGIKERDVPDLALKLEQIDEIAAELRPVFDDVMVLNSTITDMRDGVVHQINELRKERALAEVAAQAKAPKDDGQKPESETNVTQ